MEPGCKLEDFGRPVQPAVSNRSRCWALGGVWAILLVGFLLCVWGVCVWCLCVFVGVFLLLVINLSLCRLVGWLGLWHQVSLRLA